ncbi:MAG: M55 family metallopeptidase [Firmicutes bacterium]|nr:M55 family metallopeptidase [Bacillota bacterium]
MRLHMLATLALLATLSLGYHATAEPQRKLKVYISVDMEGTVGTVTSDQLGPSGFEYARYREFMTREALAAIQAARAAGATEILVSDSHGNGENLLIELLPPDVRVIRSWPRRLSMMAGLDESYDAVLFIGYHASASNPKGVRAHTFSSARLTRVAVNGVEMSEGSWNAAIAGHFGVPVVMVSGDDAAVEEVRRRVGPIEAAVVKETLGFHSARTLTPEAAYQLIAEKARTGLVRRSEFKPFRIQSPVTVEVSFKHYLMAEVAAYMPGIERAGSNSIRFTAKDMLEAADIMTFLLTYGPQLEP